jgi:hypothetical protein
MVLTDTYIVKYQYRMRSGGRCRLSGGTPC